MGNCHDFVKFIVAKDLPIKGHIFPIVKVGPLDLIKNSAGDDDRSIMSAILSRAVQAHNGVVILKILASIYNFL